MVEETAGEQALHASLDATIPADIEGPPIAVADLGSNTLHLLIAAMVQGRVVELFDESEMLRLGDDVDRTGEVSPDKAAAAIAALHRFQTVASTFGTSGLHLMATQAVRIARNQAAFLARIESETGARVSVITPEDEARLAFEGVTLSPPLGDNDRAALLGKFLLIDIGGGSTQLTLGDGPRFVAYRSLPVGSGKLTTLYVPSDPPTPAELAAARAHVERELANVPHRLGTDLVPTAAIGVGGTAKAVRRLLDPEETGVPIRVDELAPLAAELERLPAAEVALRSTLKPERARVLPAGIGLLEGVLRRFGVSELHVRWEGIRDGAVLRIARDGRL